MLNKLDQVIINQNIGATILISCFKVASPFRVIPKPTLEQKIDNRWDFPATVINQLRLIEFIETCTALAKTPQIEFPYNSKKRGLETLLEAMHGPNKTGFVLFLTGKSTVVNYETFIQIKSDQDSPDSTLSFGEIVALWDKRDPKLGICHFLVIADFSGSGQWVEQLQNLRRSDISLQASSAVGQLNRENPKTGSYFLNNWLFANNLPGKEWTEINEVVTSGTIDNTHQSQNCMFEGNLDLVRNLYGLKVGFRDWKNMRVSADDLKGNGYYIGQIGAIYNNRIGVFEKSPNGVGAMFRHSGRLVCMGSFSNGELIQTAKATILSSKNTPKNELNVHVDVNGNFYYGIFKNGLLENIGIMVTILGAKWHGNFVNGKIEGDGKFVLNSHWTIEGYFSKNRFREIRKVFKKGGAEIPFVKKDKQIDGKNLIVGNFGNIFQGNFMNGRPEGNGKWISPHGFTIEVSFENGEISKLIKLSDAIDNKIKGELLTDESVGQKMFLESNADLFEGTVVDGIKQGVGVQRTTNGLYIEGCWVNGLLEGKTRMILINGKVRLGEFKSGQIYNGKGRLLNQSTGKLMEKGEFIKGKLAGKGKRYFQNGMLFEVGLFKDGNLNGSGRRFKEDGLVVEEGVFKDGVLGTVGKIGNGAQLDNLTIGNRTKGKMDTICKLF